jgi:predicted transposase YbfD/YdcC
VKDNQPTLHDKVEALMQDLVLDHAKGNDVSVDYFEQREEGHGRVETRRVWVSDQIESLGSALLNLWAGLALIVMVERTRQDLGDFSGKVSVERCYYISSLRRVDAKATAHYIRGHRSVENNLHWQLDIRFNEDQSRTRKGHGAENYSRLNRIALNLIKRDKTVKASVKGRRLYADGITIICYDLFSNEDAIALRYHRVLFLHSRQPG